jgi:hypothetical protein
MAKDTLPFSEIFPICANVLRERLVPIHYAELTKMTLEKMGLQKEHVHWQRQIEDVREKMLIAGQYDTFYVGNPLCVGAIKWWFESEQQRLLLPTSGILIPGNASSGASGAFNALMRDPYMIVKTRARNERIKEARANGFIIEQHVSDWFQLHWPEFWQPPDNQNKFKSWCDHDFKLNLDGKIIKVDVSGKKLNGTYGNPGKGKKKTDFHLLCEIQSANILFSAVRSGSNYMNIIDSELGSIAPERLIVYLNCLKYDMDYGYIKNSLLKETL